MSAKLMRFVKSSAAFAACALCAASSLHADTATVDGYTWTYRVVDGTAEIWKDGGLGLGTTAVTPSIVREVSAIDVAKMTLRPVDGRNTRFCSSFGSAP